MLQLLSMDRLVEGVQEDGNMLQLQSIDRLAKSLLQLPSMDRLVESTRTDDGTDSLVTGPVI